jgi:hypothetical protein
VNNQFEPLRVTLATKTLVVYQYAMRKRFLAASSLILLVSGWTLTIPDDSSADATCTHYASPTGTGSGVSASQPFRIADFWRRAKAGYTLCLMDGKYTGAASVINPPKHLSGTASAPITVRALNDGSALIDGENVRNPVLLRNNNWFIIEGINAKSSRGTVVLIDKSNTSIVRRVCAWDTQLTGNHHIFLISDSKNSLFADVCGFGTGRKVFQIQKGTGNIIRRAWGQWSRSEATGPKMTYSIGYSSTNALCENCIGTWDETSMGNTPIDQPYTILGMGSQAVNQCANNRFLGSLAYVRASDKLTFFQGMAREADTAADCFTYKHVVLYVEPGTHTNLRQFQLLNGGGSSYFLTNTTEIGGSSSTIGNQWTVTNRIATSSVPLGADNIWDGVSSKGARLCKRYQNGVLTAQPLWPWPMDQRIRTALALSGKSPDEVFGGSGKTLTALLESIFGTIPSSCTSK